MSQQQSITTHNGHRIPRDIGNEYKTSNHFMQRLKYRTDPSPSKKIVRRCINEGVVKTTHVSGRFIFEKEIDDVVWWTIVAMNDEAFNDENKYHTFVSIYAPYQHEGDHKTVFEADIKT